MLPVVEYSLDWKVENPETIGKTMRSFSLDLRSIGDPSDLGFVRTINMIREKYPTAVDISLKVMCRVMVVENRKDEEETK